MKYINNRLNANIVKLEDANNNYTSENVEGALEEIDSKIKNIEDNGYDDTQIKQDIVNIKTEIGTEELTTTDQTIKGAVNEIDSQINAIVNVGDLGKNGDNVYIKDSNGNKIGNGITISTEFNNINDTTASTSTTYSSNKIESIKGDLNSQITTIENNMQNIGNPTDEQVKNVINEAIANGDIVVGGGLTNVAQTLLISILRNAVFTTDQSANITLLQSELAKSSGGGSETTKYTITNTLNNATTSNSAVLVDANSTYTTTIRENDGYTLDTITVTMGGTDITSSAVSGTTITISAVTGNVAITVTTTSSSGGSAGGEMVTDGLENYFDFRTATYNNSGAGGSTIISASQGSGSLYVWANNTISTQDEYGITQANSRSWTYNGNSVGTATTSLGASFTVIFKCYLTNISSPLFDKGYAMASNVNKIVYVPKYKTTSGTGNAPDTVLGTRKNSGYDTVTLIVDGNICKLYFGTELMQTNDGSTISDFQGWYDQLTGIGILGGNNNGYLTQMAVYNKALSEVELVDMIDYLTTLEVK